MRNQKSTGGDGNISALTTKKNNAEILNKHAQ